MAKYASRGFGVFVPGLSKDNTNCYNERIQKSKLKDLKGIDRFMKIAMELTTHNVQNPSNNVPIKLKYIQTLRDDVKADMTEDERLTNCADIDDHYDDHGITQEVLVPEIYGEDGRSPASLQWGYFRYSFAFASETRDAAIETIINCTDQEVPGNIPRKLIDAWMVEKRSREYLNDQMDKIDVDTVYYGFIYDDITDKSPNK